MLDYFQALGFLVLVLECSPIASSSSYDDSPITVTLVSSSISSSFSYADSVNNVIAVSGSRLNKLQKSSLMSNSSYALDNSSSIG